MGFVQPRVLLFFFAFSFACDALYFRECLIGPWRACLADFAGCFFHYLHLNPDGLTSINTSTSAFWLYVLKYNPLVHIPEFLIGVLAGRFFNSRGPSPPPGQISHFVFSATVILAVLLVGNVIPYPVTHTGLLAPLLAVLILSLASGGFAARALQPKWFVLLGQSSFALYVLHAPLWDYLQWFFRDSVVLNHGFGLVALAGIVGLSVALYRWVRAPLTNALRRQVFGLSRFP